MTLDAHARAELQSLMIRLAAGERAAFDPVFDRVEPLVRRFASRAVAPADVDDLVQETMLRLFSRAGEMDPERPALPWILGIAANECRSARRRRSRSRETPDLAIDDAAGAMASPEDQAIAADLRAALEKAVGSLPARDVDAILHAATGTTDGDVAGATYRKRLSRALERLRAAWRARHG